MVNPLLDMCRYVCLLECAFEMPLEYFRNMLRLFEPWLVARAF